MIKKVIFAKKTSFYDSTYEKGDTLKVSSEAYKELQTLGCVKDFVAPKPKKVKE